MSNVIAQSLPQQNKSGNIQQILLDWRGYILESTDTIFDSRKWHYRPAMEWSHFFISIYPVLQLLELSSPEIYFPRINSVTNFIEGTFDCSFMRVEMGDNDQIFVWTIFDNTAHYEKIQKIQQRLNELRLKGV
jgi:hypothetical protein